MKNIYSLAEIEALREATKGAIAEIIREETKDGAKTARELAKATNGLCSTRHIANTICANGDSWRGVGYYEHNQVKYHKTTVRKVKHFAELNESGDIIRRFDLEQVTHVNEYKMD